MDVLIVDDDVEVLRFLRIVMGLRGWVVRVATSAEEALLELALRRPDLLLLDLCLPRRDGVGLLELLDRGLGRPRQVVLISALPPPTVATIADRFGLPYLTKPFELEDLERVLEETMAGAGRSDRA